MFKLTTVLFLFFAFILTRPEATLPGELLPPPGTIEFIGDAGSPNAFTFERWAFTKIENADDPKNIKVEAVFDVSSLKCDWKELERSVLKKKDYFFVRKFPEARLSIDGAAPMGDGKYKTQALLTLKGVSKEVELMFSLSGEGPYTVHAEGVIQRRMFKFKGDGPKEEVPVRVDAVLTTGQ